MYMKEKRLLLPQQLEKNSWHSMLIIRNTEWFNVSLGYNIWLLTLQGYFLKNDYFFKVQKIMHQRKQYLLKIWKLWRVSRWLAQSESWDFGAQRISRAWVLGKTAGKAWDLAVWLVRWPFSAALPNSVGYWQLSVTFLNMAFPFQHLCRLHSPHLSKTTRPPTTLTTEACFDADDDV